MKKNSTSQSAFFNLRVLVGLFVGMTGISLALFAANPFRPAPALAQPKYKVTSQSGWDPLVPAGFDCSKIHELGIDKQENFRAGAIMIYCGLAEGGKPSPAAEFSQFINSLLPGPLA